MNADLQLISELTKDLIIVTPPGQFEEYTSNGTTYLIKEDDNNEIIADNPYIIEYLLFNNKKNLIPSVSNMVYLEKRSIRLHKKNNSLNIFFHERMSHFLHFPIEDFELPIFKIFLDHIGYNRRRSDFFFWDLDGFLKLITYIDVSRSQKVDLHKRLCKFHTSKFPLEAVKSIFINTD